MINKNFLNEEEYFFTSFWIDPENDEFRTLNNLGVLDLGLFSLSSYTEEKFLQEVIPYLKILFHKYKRYSISQD